MIGDSALLPSRKSNALLAIAVGGLIAGALDLTQASVLFGCRVPLTIAAGLLGRGAFHGGIATYFLGVLLHFFIAFSAAAVYYATSRRLGFLKEHPLVCGLFYGAAVDQVSYCFAALSASCQRPLPASRPYSGTACAHGRGRTADLLQRSAVCEIDV
jgi:hypothetical protein